MEARGDRNQQLRLSNSSSSNGFAPSEADNCNFLVVNFKLMLSVIPFCLRNSVFDVLLPKMFQKLKMDLDTMIACGTQR